MKCVGGPISGKEMPGPARLVEAPTEDGRIARYEQSGDVYMLRGHFVATPGPEWVRFAPVESLTDFA